MLSDIENLDVMLGRNHFSDIDREESPNSNLAGGPESAVSNNFENDNGEMCSNRDLGANADCGQNSAIGKSSAEINRLSSELNSRLSGELDEMMGIVNTQIQRAISDAKSNQILPQIQTALYLTQNRWNVPSEGPEMNPEETYGEKTKKNSRCEQRLDYQNGSQPNLRAYDSHQVMRTVQVYVHITTTRDTTSIC